MLQVGGIVAVVLLLSVVHSRFVADEPYDYVDSFRFAWSIAYMGLIAVAAYAVGLPELPRSGRSAFVSALAATAAAALGISVVQLVTGDALLPRFVVFGSAVLLVPWLALCSRAASEARARAEERDRVLLVGDAADTATLGDDLDLAPERPAHLVASLTSEEASASGPVGPLTERAEATRATVLVLSRSAQADEGVVAQAAQLHAGGLRVRTLSLFYEEWLGKLPVSELERVSLMFDIGEIHRLRYARVKRIFDLFLAAVGLVFLVLLTPLVFVGDLVANRGPLLYRQQRVGRGGRVFTIVKFRTMAPAAGGPVDEWTSEDDPRITGLGHLLRRTHLDELPQVVNVLRGDLSLVGPRPEQPGYVAELREKLPFYEVRHLVRPGITGWAQVKYGYAGNEADALEKLQYEFFYLRRQSLSFDARILVRTLRSVFGGEGR
ncbi:MAG: sugar transferase [Acidimicrobiales bacterium]|nr:sugar transferase [Acidimicrobiales bacterium]